MNSGGTDFFSELARRARELRFPKDFVLGTATAAYQIEGAVKDEGRGESIWDRFSHGPGNIRDGSTGDIACEHYWRWREDIELMRRLRADAYRFSIAWSRVMPVGRGAVNGAGLDFYDRLVDGLLEAGIAPFATLYHWDLPQALQDDGGGWLRRQTIDDYLAYVDVVTARLGDRVRHWTTFNELWTFTWWGYAFGEDAPGLNLGARGALAAGHHALLAHGRAISLIRANVPDAQVGIVLDLNKTTPASDRVEDIAAAKRFDGCQNRWYLDALFKGAYPSDMLETYRASLPTIQGDDLETIATPMDFLGINVYRRSIIAAGTEMPPIDFRRLSPPGEYTSMGWEVSTTCLFDIVCDVYRGYSPKTIYVTENGAAFPDAVDLDGRIRDWQRARYLIQHLEQAKRALAAGVPLAGYFCWTLMDNFEWAEGYRPRFGLVHVNFSNQRRTIKASGELFAIAAAKRDASVDPR